MSSDIEKYIQNARDKKISDELIRKKLIEFGWNNEQIDQALSLSTPEDMLPIPPSPPASLNSTKKISSHNSMWDAFEHIILFISLFVMSTAFALLLHNFVDLSFQSASTSYDGSYRNSYSSNYYDEVIMWCIATLIVSTPIFIGLFINLLHRTKQNPAIRELHARKILTYAALVITFIILIYKIITILYSLLSGNVTFNIFLHFLITVGVSGSIFGYYFYQVKEDRSFHE